MTQQTWSVSHCVSQRRFCRRLYFPRRSLNLAATHQILSHKLRIFPSRAGKRFLASAKVRAYVRFRARPSGDGTSWARGRGARRATAANAACLLLLNSRESGIFAIGHFRRGAFCVSSAHSVYSRDLLNPCSRPSTWPRYFLKRARKIVLSRARTDVSRTYMYIHGYARDFFFF